MSATAGAVLAGGALSSIAGSRGASKAAKYQRRGQEAALELRKKIYEEQKEFLEPYRNLGLNIGVPGLQELSTQGGQADFYRQFYQSPQFSALSGAARGQQLAASEATGDVRGSATSNQLARIAPSLGLQALQGQQQLYGNLANIGQNAAAGTATAGGQYATAAGQGLIDIGTIRGFGARAPYDAFGQFIGGAGGYLGKNPDVLTNALQGLF